MAIFIASSFRTFSAFFRLDGFKCREHVYVHFMETPVMALYCGYHEPRRAQTKSAQQWPCLKPLWGNTNEDIYMQWSARRDDLSGVVQKHTWHRLDRGPSGFLGLSSAITMPLPRESNTTCCSNIVLMILVRGVDITLPAYSSLLDLGHAHCWETQVLSLLQWLWLFDWVGFVKYMRKPCSAMGNSTWIWNVNWYTSVACVSGLNS